MEYYYAQTSNSHFQRIEPLDCLYVHIIHSCNGLKENSAILANMKCDYLDFIIT